MNSKLGATIAAVVGGVALAASPALAQMHGGGGHMGGGGGFHASGRTGGSFHSGMSGFRGGDFRGGGFRGGGFRGGFHHHFCCGFGPGFGFWGDPFYWGGLGFVAGYDLAPYSDDYYGPYGDPYADEPPEGYAPGRPAGYDCDGWRWDAAQNRYVAAKVACN
jgi:hypothetical protein